MSLVFPLLLGGLVLAGIPILLHLLLRQRPKRVPFPAVRFLFQKLRTNQRSWRLRHLLLLALRMGLIVLICLALVQPKTAGVAERFVKLHPDQPVLAILVFDTSLSMEYPLSGRTRLEDAKRRAEEVLQLLPPGSRIAVLDTAERGGGQWLPSVPQARDQIAALELRPGNAAVTDTLPEAYRLFEELEATQAGRDKSWPRYLWVFADRTRACWDATRVAGLREKAGVKPVNALFVDVGTDKPIDLAIANVELPREGVPANSPVLLRVTVLATGQPCDIVVSCRIDGEDDPEKKPVQLPADQRAVVVFERRGLKPGVHQAEIALATRDSLPFDDVRYASFEVRPPRQVLVVSDEPDDCRIWMWALAKGESPFTCEVISTKGPLPANLGAYQAVCLLNVRRPTATFWERMLAYVTAGGGLAIIPGGELDLPAYGNDENAKTLMPGTFKRALAPAASPALRWEKASYRSPVKGWFDVWERTPNIALLRFPPLVAGYWEVAPAEAGVALVRYDDRANRPALLETAFDRQKVRGRVLLFTTPLDDRCSAEEPRWHNYVQAALAGLFIIPLAKKTIGYLAGDEEDIRLNYLTGPVVQVALPPAGRFKSYQLTGPGLGSGVEVLRGDEPIDLPLPLAQTPGNYQLSANQGKWTTAFSLNPPPDECDLSRVPVEEIDRLFGEDAVLPMDTRLTLQQALRNRGGEPIPWFPCLMVLLLIALAVETLLSNLFYRRSEVAGTVDTKSQAEATPAVPVPASAAQASPVAAAPPASEA